MRGKRSAYLALRYTKSLQLLAQAASGSIAQSTSDPRPSTSTVANTASLCGSDELKWGWMGSFRLSHALLSGLARGSIGEVKRMWQRVHGRYDLAVTHVIRQRPQPA
jgi:hypothetical protein